MYVCANGVCVNVCANGVYVCEWCVCVCVCVCVYMCVCTCRSEITKKYTFATLRNCSNKFLGTNEYHVYREVVTEFDTNLCVCVCVRVCVCVCVCTCVRERDTNTSVE